ncbi:MAG TPA: sigma-70 family RNA polymerase sigma factor [Salinivirgaceae bacterium]|nr:sigma-70 family RNA polymerase sigma factor [Salinivirgaceae bacterium]
MNIAQLTDYELIRLYLSGNEVAFEEIIERHKDKVYTYLLMLTKNKDLAEDLFQETFYKVVKSLREQRYQEDGRFIGWILRIAHNLVIDHYRRKKNMQLVTQEEGKPDIFNKVKQYDTPVEDSIISSQVSKKVRVLINQLPDEQREVVIMRHYLDMSFKEIAEVTNVSINTALGRMRYALINLRKMIDEHSLQLI